VTDERVMLSARVPAELKRMVDADRRNNQEVLEAALWREFGGKKKGLIETQIDRKAEQLDSITSERDELDSEASRLRTELEALRQRLDEVEETDSYEDSLRSLLEGIENGGGHIWPDHNDVGELANMSGQSPGDVIEDARRLAASEDMDIYTTQFVRAADAQYVEKARIGEAYTDE